jgi:endonuclease-3 related protein
VAAGIDDISSLARARLTEVQHCIRSIAFAPTKSGRLIAFARHLRARGFENIEAFLSSAETIVLRNDLLSLPGIGHETADAILLFAGDRHPTFVIDAYTRRIFTRTRLRANLDEAFWMRPAPVLRSFLQQHLLASRDQYDGFDWDEGVPRDVALMRDYHAQLVELGRHHCLKSKPRCHVTGKHGWAGYDFCREHCTSEKCTACPLSGMCRHAMWSGDVR